MAVDLFRRGVEGEHLGVYPLLAHPAGDQLRVLRSKIQDGDPTLP
jgi:hypothetical protein